LFEIAPTAFGDETAAFAAPRVDVGVLDMGDVAVAAVGEV
jgi:hypothetical protein